MARKKKAAAKKPAKKASKKSEILVVQSKVREHVKGLGDFNIGSDLMGAVSARVESMLADASKRAGDNGRKTIQARDV
ncbi:MAG: hypothetical protein ACXAE3_12865 [Candidatus Kariarchaeaceae archaeon]|jgi:histone H3/H4